MQLNTFTPNPSENTVTKIVYQVKSAIPGRIRWHIRGLKNSRIQQMLKNFFESLNGVTHVRINAMAESVIVTFSEQKLSATDLQEKFAQSIPDISSPHPSVSPLPENLETEEKAKPIQQEINEAKRKTKNSIPESKITQDTIALKSSSSPKHSPEKKLISQEKLDSSSQEESVTPNADFWKLKCEEQAKTIEQLEQQLTQLISTASIGANLLHKGDIYKSNPVKPEKSFTSPIPVPSLETLKKQGNWQQLAQRQSEKIAQLQQEISEQQRLSAIADFHLNKWRYRFF